MQMTSQLAIDRRNAAHPRREMVEPTLHSALGSSSSQSTHRANHEVLNQLVRPLPALADVFAEIRNLGTLGRALEGAVVRGPGSGSAPFGRSDGCGAEGGGADGGGLGRGAEACAGSVRERRHRVGCGGRRREGRGVEGCVWCNWRL